MKIAIIGYMGSGKTFLGRQLARSCRFRFFDLDFEIEKASGSTISELFEQHGERHFRTLERDVLRKVAWQKGPFVLATGGGTVMCEECRSILRRTMIPVWIDPPFHVIWRRIRKSSLERPLVSSYSQSELRQIWYKRRKLYQSVALLHFPRVVSPINLLQKLQMLQILNIAENRIPIRNSN